VVNRGFESRLVVAGLTRLAIERAARSYPVPLAALGCPMCPQ
jgi:hypothetical protein